MISKWELWACAHHYITEHGKDAGLMAAFRCDELRDAGDHDGARSYQAIIARIIELLEGRSGSLH